MKHRKEMKTIIAGMLAASTALAFDYDNWGDYSWGEDNELNLNLSLDGNGWNGSQSQRRELGGIQGRNNN